MVAGLVAAAALLVLLRAPDAERYVESGIPAPGFRLPRLGDGEPLALEDLRGRIVLLNFWATWCKPCEDEMPSMQRLYDQLGGQGFELVAISVDEEAAPVAAFRERFGLTFPILLDPQREAAGAYQTHRYPESFLIGADGVVLQRYIGPREWDGEEYLRRIHELVQRGGR